MKNSIYNILNDVKIDLSNYQSEEMTQIEKETIKMKWKQSLKYKKAKKKYVIAAAMVFISVSLVGMNFNSVYGEIKSIAYDISSYLGIKSNLKEYKTVVGQSVTDKGITVTLNEVLIDNDELIVSSTATSEKATSDIGIFPMDGIVEVNGKKMIYGSSGSSQMLDKYTGQSVMNYYIHELDLKEDLDVTITFHSVFLEGEEIKGKWGFKFKTNGGELAAHTIKVAIGSSFQLPDGCKIQLKTYTSNAIGSKIYFDIEGDMKYNMELRGKDDIGNQVVFYMSRTENGKGVFELETIHNGNLNQNAAILFLTPFAVKFPEKSGKMSNNFEQIGEQFEFNIK